MKMPSMSRAAACQHCRNDAERRPTHKSEGSWTAGGGSRTEGNVYTVKCEGKGSGERSRLWIRSLGNQIIQALSIHQLGECELEQLSSIAVLRIHTVTNLVSG